MNRYEILKHPERELRTSDEVEKREMGEYFKARSAVDSGMSGPTPERIICHVCGCAYKFDASRQELCSHLKAVFDGLGLGFLARE